jgi:mannose-1-phosphate guanylyltransferase/phosphomannomutase
VFFKIRNFLKKLDKNNKNQLKKGTLHLMKTIIMAGGEGKRLRPLTCSLPKPLLPLLEKPIIEYILDLLCFHKISSAVITTGYMAEKIEEHFPIKKYRGIDLSFSSEDTPLGTAGSVKNAMKGIRDDVLVISGDALCDFNLSEAIKFHRNQKSSVTIIGKKVSDPREYGLLEVSGDRVSGFLEKPDFSKVLSSIANTGIYILSERILSLIPDGK